MSCHGLQFTSPDGEVHCIPIYMIQVEWPPEGPHPDPWRHVFNDVAVLTTINEGIARISDRKVRDTLSQTVQNTARSMTMPKGLALGDGLFKERRAFAAV